MRVERGQLNPGAVIRPAPGGWQPRMPERLDEEELADWRARRGLSLAALTIGALIAPRRRIGQASPPYLLCSRSGKT
jgi:hypothetical protein